MGTFYSMGGYGVFIWSAYFLMAIVFLGNFIAPLKKFRKIKTELRGKP